MLFNNLLLYAPPPTSAGDTLREKGAAVPVQCEYGRCIYTQKTRALCVLLVQTGSQGKAKIRDGEQFML